MQSLRQQFGKTMLGAAPTIHFLTGEHKPRDVSKYIARTACIYGRPLLTKSELKIVKQTVSDKTANRDQL